MFIERALSVIFETKWFIKIYEEKSNRNGIKEFVALVVSITACILWKLDALTIILVSHEEMQAYGYVLTGFVVAGGSKGSIKLFKTMMGFMSSAEKERITNKKIN
jgi:hypothetical protein